MKQRVSDICKIGDSLFSKRQPVVTLWQELAENFYPERADFLVKLSLTDSFAANLVSSAPVLARRDLANQLQAMLRPRGKQWFGLTPEDKKLEEDSEVTEFNKWLVERQRKFMDDARAQMQRATKQADNDYTTFGQAILSVEPVIETSTLLYRSWHLRDVAFSENNHGVVDNIHRNWSPTFRQIAKEYGLEKLHSSVRENAEKDPEHELKTRHVIIPFDEYDWKPEKTFRTRTDRFKFMKICVDIENQHIIYERPTEDHPYIIPRWQLVSGSPYAHSPAAHYALPDARTLQAISYTMLQAGELTVNPNMVATQEVVRSDVDIRPGGITWVDAEYDERLGEALRPMSRDTSGLKFGVDVADRHLAMVHEAFFLNKINLPPMSGDMTAYEVQVRTQEYIRNALPLFEPMETEYNAPLCEKTFNVLMRMGAFGDTRKWPEAMRRAELKWTFESPLAETEKMQESKRFMEAANLLSMAVQIDPNLKEDWEYREQFREAMRGLGAPVRDEDEADEKIEEGQQMAEMMQAMQMAGQAGAAVEQVGKGGQAFSEMQAMSEQGAA